MIKLHNGTIVDVIREQLKKQDADKQTLCIQLEAEFGLDKERNIHTS